MMNDWLTRKQMNTYQRRPTVLVLISSGFEEESTIRCMKELRTLGLEVKLVGLKAGLIVGVNGLTIYPDVTLANLELPRRYRLIVIPGSSQSTKSLLTDPRIFQLFAGTTKRGGWIAIMNKAEAAFVQAGMLQTLADTNVIVQGSEDLSSFVRRLVHLIAS